MNSLTRQEPQTVNFYAEVLFDLLSDRRRSAASVYLTVTYVPSQGYARSKFAGCNF